MNIGIVTTWFERGAAYVSKQFEEILSIRHDVYIFARGGESFAKGNPQWDKPNVHWSKFCVNSKYINRKEFLLWLKRNNIDVVLFNEQNDFAPILYCKELGIKTIAYIDYYTEETIPLFNVYDALICNTKRHLSAFENHPHAYYVPWGTDVNLYKPINEDGHLVNDGYVTFFNSAGMNPLRKGSDTLIKALDSCGDRSNVKVIIHSQRDLRQFFPELKSTIDKLVKEGSLELIEKTVSAPGLYYKADVYVYPSILDGIGLTVPEAISSGLACLASDNPPMNEFFDETCGSLIPIDRLYARKDGYYWPQCRCDVKALAELIERYASNKEEVVRKKKEARKYALKYLSFEKNANSLFDLLESVSFTNVDPIISLQINNENRGFFRKLRNFIIDKRLYRLPFKFIKRLVRSHDLYT